MSKTKTPAPETLAAPAEAAADVVVPPAKPKARARKPAAATPPTAVADAPKPAKPAKPGKPKLVRDSFTIPKDEYQVIDLLKARALALGKPVKKSELLRAGLRALHAMSDRSLLGALKAVPTLKTGRPKTGGDQA